MLFFASACSRAELDGLSPSFADAGPDACSGMMTVGTVTRLPAIGHVPLGGPAIDPDDDVLLTLGGLSGDGMWAQSITGVSLGTGAPTTFTLSGDAVSLGPTVRAVWEPTHHRMLGLGGSLNLLDPTMYPMDDTAQVFALRLQGTSAVLSVLPKFPEGETGDVPLPAAVDPVSGRLFALPEKGGVKGPVHTYVLDTTPGHESWSLFHTDTNPAVADITFVGLAYDPMRRRLVANGTTFDTLDASMWALSLDSPAGWVRIAGTFPASLLGYETTLAEGLPLVWDETQCAFVVAATGSTCEYEVWRFDIGEDSFTATALGVAVQPTIPYGRGGGAFDARRRNFVFGSAFDCDLGADYVADSTDFLPVTP